MQSIKVVMLDTYGVGMSWLDQFSENVELSEIVTLDGSEGVSISDLMDYEGWEYLLVFLPEDEPLKQMMQGVLEKCGIPGERVIYPMDLLSLMDHKAASYCMFNDTIRKMIAYLENRTASQYITCTANELSYIGASSDLVIMRKMHLTGENWAKDDLIHFQKLAGRYYHFTEQQTLFCDIGANIGTSCIFFKKKLDPDVKILAFEPMPPIYKCLKINMILNDIAPEDYTLVNAGLSNRNDTQTMSYRANNPGSSNYVYAGASLYETNILRFDDYLAENQVKKECIKYLWIDIEGFEALFCEGATQTLGAIDVPIVMEFTPEALCEHNTFDILIDFLNMHYRAYIRLDDETDTIHPIEELRKYKAREEWVQFDIFLLKQDT